MARAYNFCAGPAAIPEAVLKRVQEELLEWNGRGTSVMEISHRSTDFIQNVLEPAEANFRKLLAIPKNYHVLFVSAGTSNQFAMAPLNLLNLSDHHEADYFHTGVWSGKAVKEAQRYGSINISTLEKINLNSAAAYVHYTPNETIDGIQFHAIPEVGDVPLVADMSSEILSKSIDINRFGLIYAGAQKNIGPSGLTMVIIRDDLVGHAKTMTPTLYNYQTYVETQSLYNTPNTFGIYMAGLVFEWLLNQGGLSEVEKINKRKAEKLYHCIDEIDFYRNDVNRDYRSEMNIIFYCPSPELDKLFVEESTKNGLVNLKGHKAIGGIRASIYNAMPEAGVDALISFMKDFEKRYG